MLGLTQLLLALHFLHHHGLITAHPLSTTQVLAKRGFGGASVPCSHQHVLIKRMEGALKGSALSSAAHDSKEVQGALGKLDDLKLNLEEPVVYLPKSGDLHQQSGTHGLSGDGALHPGNEAAGENGPNPAGGLTADSSGSNQVPPNQVPPHQVNPQEVKPHQEPPHEGPTHKDPPQVDEPKKEVGTGSGDGGNGAAGENISNPAEGPKADVSGTIQEPPHQVTQEEKPHQEPPHEGPTHKDPPQVDEPKKEDGTGSGSGSGEKGSKGAAGENGSNAPVSGEKEPLPINPFIQGIIDKEMEKLTPEARETNRKIMQENKLRREKAEAHQRQPSTPPEQSTAGASGSTSSQGEIRQAKQKEKAERTSQHKESSSNNPQDGNYKQAERTSQQKEASANNPQDGNYKQAESTSKEKEASSNNPEDGNYKQAERKSQQKEASANNPEDGNYKQAERTSQQKETSANNPQNVNSEIPHGDPVHDGTKSVGTENSAANHGEGDGGKVPPPAKENEMDPNLEKKLKDKNLEFGKEKPTSRLVNYWRKLTTKMKMAWNRFWNFVLRRKKSSVHPDGTAAKVLDTSVPYNPPNESPAIATAVKGEQGQLRPRPAPPGKDQREPPYTIPDPEKSTQ